MAQERNTEELIIEAARRIFIKRGLAGARMQDIADEAGINKAMLHYYYRSKEKLFEIVFDEAFSKMVGRLGAVLNKPMPIEEKIRTLIDHYITSIAETPYVPIFVLNEINQQPEMMIKRVSSQPSFPDIMAFMKEVVEAGKKGIIKEISPLQLFLNIVSMCIFPFVARPLIQGIFQQDNIQFNMLIEERKKLVGDVIISWLKP
ncbi:TetR/AcrR family transcriptional regulator [Chitinophaga sp. S165]|uniref:TetR/AcrR family transcriptional regulator n=1 Tax=Chitinophaga sp. S165 TaxID=2135462 RepID=UPI000D70A803|nr:TetR/AcrR family transcriptional regulator [Chitinophaga sp. S165]PWV57084.1 TetR family transcriptional regulator [Chitinophaga sp. S165]